MAKYLPFIEMVQKTAAAICINLLLNLLQLFVISFADYLSYSLLLQRSRTSVRLLKACSNAHKGLEWYGCANQF